MSSIIQLLQTTLDTFGELTVMVLNSISMLFLILGIVISFGKSIRKKMSDTAHHPLHTYFRMLLGGWLVVSLEFLLAADIVDTIISPTNSRLVELGAIALIRTFLNYSLNRELREQNQRVSEMSMEKNKNF